MIDMEYIKHIFQFVVISMVAAAIQLYLSPHAFTFARYFFNALMALLAAYLVSSFCDFWQVAEAARPGFIGVGAYLAPHLFNGLNTLGQRFSKDPLKVINQLRRK